MCQNYRGSSSPQSTSQGTIVNKIKIVQKEYKEKERLFIN